MHNNAFVCEDFIICGSRGWYNDDKNAPMRGADSEKIVAREVVRLGLSLNEGLRLREEAKAQDGREREMLAFLHFPPYWNEKRTPGIYDLLKEYEIRNIYFGHIHNSYNIPAINEADGMRFHLISADYLDFLPKIIKNH